MKKALFVRNLPIQYQQNLGTSVEVIDIENNVKEEKQVQISEVSNKKRYKRLARRLHTFQDASNIPFCSLQYLCGYKDFGLNGKSKTRLNSSQQLAIEAILHKGIENFIFDRIASFLDKSICGPSLDVVKLYLHRKFREYNSKSHLFDFQIYINALVSNGSSRLSKVVADFNDSKNNVLTDIQESNPLNLADNLQVNLIVQDDLPSSSSNLLIPNLRFSRVPMRELLILIVIILNLILVLHISLISFSVLAIVVTIISWLYLTQLSAIEERWPLLRNISNLLQRAYVYSYGLYMSARYRYEPLP